MNGFLKQAYYPKQNFFSIINQLPELYWYTKMLSSGTGFSSQTRIGHIEMTHVLYSTLDPSCPVPSIGTTPSIWQGREPTFMQWETFFFHVRDPFWWGQEPSVEGLGTNFGGVSKPLGRCQGSMLVGSGTHFCWVRTTLQRRQEPILVCSETHFGRARNPLWHDQ